MFTACTKDDDAENALSNGSEVRLPGTAKEVKYEPLSLEETAKLEAKGYKFIATPLSVTQNGDPHVQLDQRATVRFLIPADVPKERYYDLLGVIFNEEGPQYMIPDGEELEKGYLTFHTSHFCVTAGIEDKNKALNTLIDRVAANGWQNSLCDADLEATLMEKLEKMADDCGFGKNDFLGAAAREALKDNEWVRDAVSLAEGKSPESLIAEKLEARFKEKTLGLLFDQLKKNENNPKLKQFLETHLTVGNAEDWAKQLGEGKDPMVIAKDYAKGFVTSSLEELSEKLVPFVGTVKKTAETMKFLKQFWADNEVEYYYQTYKNASNRDDAWQEIEWRKLAATMSHFGMTAAQMRAKFDERIKQEAEIAKRKTNIRKLIEIWDTRDLFTLVGQKTTHLDLTQRVTMVHNLVERFRKELVVNGKIPNQDGAKSLEQMLAYIVEKYLEFYPDVEKFYQWLEANGHGKNKFKRLSDALEKDRSWWLVRTDLEKPDDSLNDYYKNKYSVEENKHMNNVWTTEEYYSYPEDIKCPPVNLFFTTTCQTPPAHIEAKDTILLHATITLSGTEKVGYYMHDEMSLGMDYEDVGQGYITSFGQSHKAAAINKVGGGTYVAARFTERQNSGECDFKLGLPSGSKDKLYAINFNGSGCRTHWVYRWATIFEKDLPLEK